MGGFYNAAAKLATEGIEKAGAAAAKAFPSIAPRITAFAQQAAENTETGMYHSMFPSKAAFQDIPAAKRLWQQYEGPYKEMTNKYTAMGIQNAKAAGTNKPLQEIEKEARNLASDNAFGKNRSGIQAVLKNVEQTHGKNRADILADHLNILFRESQDAQGLSKFDRDMRKGPERYDTPPSPYKDPNFLERNLAKKHQAMLAYKASIPHLASNLNILISDGFQTYAKTLAREFGPGRKGAEAQVLATNAISELVSNSYREKQAFEAGIIHKYAPGGVGEFIHNNMYIPGFSRVRYETVMMSAHASMLSAQEALQHLMKGNNRMALPMLRELGLDANKIKAQGGFNAEDIDKIYYHGTDFRAFLNYAEGRTALSQRSPLFRVMGAYHNYVTRQSRFFAQVFKRQYAQGDFIGIARNVGLLGTAFPIVGSTIYETERLLSGNDWDDPIGHLGEKIEATPGGMAYDAVTGKQNATKAGKMAVNTIEQLAHTASWGVATGYIRGASRAHLANQILGPDANMMIQGTEDAVKALHIDSNHPDSAKPLERDILSDVPSLGIGSILSHKLVPSKRELSVGKPKRFRRTKPKADSWNPLNQ